MRRIQKVMAGVFLGGVLLGGIGTGTAMVEYSTLSYGGERLLGEEYVVTKNLDFEFPQDGRTLILVNDYYFRHAGGRIETDETVPVGTVRYEITYNERRVTPELAFEEYEEPVWEKDGDSREAGERQEETEPEGEWPQEPEPEESEPDRTPRGDSEPEEFEPDKTPQGESEPEEPEPDRTPRRESEPEESEPNGIQPEESQPEAGASDKKEPVCLGYLRLDIWDHDNAFTVFMENKDFFLEELKQKKISSYREAYITKITVKVHPETRPFVKGGDNW